MIYHKSSSEVKSGDPKNSLFQCMIAKIDAVTYKLYRRKMGQNSLPQNKREQLGFLDIILGKTTDFYCNLNKKGYICPKTWVFDPENAP